MFRRSGVRVLAVVAPEWVVAHSQAGVDQLRIRPDYPELIAALEKCEFKSLLQEVKEEASRRAATAQAELSL